MACYHPLAACVISTPQGRSISFDRGSIGEPISLPCGRCIGCRVEKARQWAVRLMHESEMHESNSFLTLTYSDEFLPKDGSISKIVCQLFLKRLRAKIFPVKIRFFLCGEYGERSARPHYHAIIFGFDFPDKVSLKSDGEFALYRSDLLDKVWGFGFCSIGHVSFDSACYVANYATKKINGPKAAEHYGGRLPEFLLMSRGGRGGAGGLGASWIKKFYDDVYPSDEVISKGRPSRPPRFYDEQFERLCKGDEMKDIKDRRRRYAALLEEEVNVLGRTILIHPSHNPWRLLVREKIAKAKASLKSRNVEF